MNASRRGNNSTQPPAVSVLMPCFNAAETLEEAIDSILHGTWRDLELIAVDDGSSDATARLLRRRAEGDPRLRLVFLEHGGIVRALNAGLALVRAPLVARMDADDLAHRERLEQQLAFMEKYPSLAAAGCLVDGFPAESVRTGFRLYLEWMNRLTEPEAIARQIFVESPLAHPSMVIRRSWLQRMGGYQDFGWPEDYDLWMRMDLAGARFAKVPRVLLHWREHLARLTRTDSRYAVEQFLRAKAHYLCLGPLQGRNAVVIWGSGQMGRRLSKHLLRLGAPLVAFVDIDPAKIGRLRRQRPIISPHALPGLLANWQRPVVLAAVGSRGARALIGEQLRAMGLREGQDWWAAA
jgi:glycosyltransferase involved in cell wall biosynthesis